jgi:hypothetical protein
MPAKTADTKRNNVWIRCIIILDLIIFLQI